MKPIAAIIKREAIRLRVQQNLSTPAIARQLRISNFSVYRVLKNHPWKRPRRYGKLAWSIDEEETVRRLYPESAREVIEAALPGRTWGTIIQKAVGLGVKRDPKRLWGKKRHAHPFLEQLRQERMRRKITREQLASRLGHAVGQLHAWETGKAAPTFHAVADWAAALGMRLVLTGGLDAVASVDAPQVPTKARMMAGR